MFRVGCPNVARAQFLWRHYALFSTARFPPTVVVDLRSDTVTRPSKEMLAFSQQAKVGDDVMGEDPTVQELQDRVARMFGKEAALYVPTGTMANLVAIMAHCHTRAAEIIAGTNSHICLWEGGNAAGLAGVSVKQVEEDEAAKISDEQILDALRTDVDDHWPETKLLCLENTHNMLGGVALSKDYMNQRGRLARRIGIKTHLDGARIFNAAVALDESPADLCQEMDSVSVCLSKGLGAPLGSVLVGDKEFIRLAKRARKRCGGGMRQAGVVAAMGLYALEHNVVRIPLDHQRAKYLGGFLLDHGFHIPRQGMVDTNIVYFELPPSSKVSREDFVTRLEADHGVKLTGGYSKGGSLFRLVTHLDLDDSDIEFAAKAIVETARQG